MHYFRILKYFLDLTALRFQIFTLSEDLRMGGFTHRRVSISQLPFSVGMTQEQFEYKWMSPEGRPVTPQPSPEMYVQLKSPKQFGLYTIRVRGIHSGYTHELQSDVLLQCKSFLYLTSWKCGLLNHPKSKVLPPTGRVDKNILLGWHYHTVTGLIRHYN